MFQILAVLGIFGASFIKVDIVWQLADLFNGLMVLPNIVALILLAPIVVMQTPGLCWKSIPLLGKISIKNEAH